MTCTRILGGIICTSPWGRLKLGNRYINVDFHEYCGPSFTWVKGGEWYDPKDENDPIWPLFEAWLEKYMAKQAKTKARQPATQSTDQPE